MSEEKTKIEQAKEKCLDTIIEGSGVVKDFAEAYLTLVNAEYNAWQLEKKKPTPE
jgi:hypothetical protein